MSSSGLVMAGLSGLLAAIFYGVYTENNHDAQNRSLHQVEFSENEPIYSAIIEKAFDDMDINLPNKPTYKDIKVIHNNSSSDDDVVKRMRNTQKIAVNLLAAVGRHHIKNQNSAQSFMTLDSKGPIIQAVPGASLSSIGIDHHLTV